MHTSRYQARRGSTPAGVPQGSVPRVVGLGLREAVNKLEDAGYNVKINGAGYVIKQLPLGGDSIPPGNTVTLTLSQDT